MMTAPRLIACSFPGGRDATGRSSAAIWPRLAHVLAYTAAQHCPEWDVQIRTVTPPAMTSALGVSSHVHNTQKMDLWFDAVAAAADGDRLLLIDADTVILRSLDDVWAEPFDFGYTIKPSRFPFNSGVVFLRISPAVRFFMLTWRNENRRMLKDPHHHQTWRRQYGGINQAALGSVLKQGKASKLTVRALPCVEWNCEDSSWPQFDPAVTRILHIKSALRRAVFNILPSPALTPLVKRWRDLEQQALARAAVAS